MKSPAQPAVLASDGGSRGIGIEFQALKSLDREVHARTVGMRFWVTACLLLLAACSGLFPGSDEASDQEELLLNVCPPEGCRVDIEAIDRQGSELSLTLRSNFKPSLDRNHFHVYWDNFSAEQVSEDSVLRFHVRKGDWEATEDNPYLTSGAASLESRGESMALCVTAADAGNNVIDPELSDCFDVGVFVN